ncbi:ATP-binding protein [Streptomyces sp. IB2014 016-6]|uniref:ATP-binding protein n=1 Tax=Streptomyces sp. IB2014 016-6 TaxID=2517818 RepID=UPI00164F3714|nr:ATP-binding protein [Streptomyces sp. IB2014 016-6]
MTAESSRRHLLDTEQQNSSLIRSLAAMPLADPPHGLLTAGHAMIIEQSPRPFFVRRGGAVLQKRSAVCAMAAETRTVPALRAFTRDMATQWGTPAETVDALRMIATELVTNTVLHSGSSEVILLLTVDDRTATVEVKDTGRWQEQRCAAGTPEQAVDGRGLHLVHAYSTTCRVERTSQGTAVLAELRIPRPPPDCVSAPCPATTRQRAR